jgi:hypothetical protein
MGDNIKMDIEEIGWEVVGWIRLAQVRIPYDYSAHLRSKT